LFENQWNEGYWGGGIFIISQNFSKSHSILFHPLNPPFPKQALWSCGTSMAFSPGISPGEDDRGQLRLVEKKWKILLSKSKEKDQEWIDSGVIGCGLLHVLDSHTVQAQSIQVRLVQVLIFGCVSY
jgi:hypothetical protein